MQRTVGYTDFASWHSVGHATSKPLVTVRPVCRVPRRPTFKLGVTNQSKQRARMYSPEHFYNPAYSFLVGAGWDCGLGGCAASTTGGSWCSHAELERSCEVQSRHARGRLSQATTLVLACPLRAAYITTCKGARIPQFVYVPCTTMCRSSCPTCLLQAACACSRDRMN